MTRSIGGEHGRSLGEKLYTRPSAEISALAAGDPVGPSRGTIPSLATAMLQFSLVPDQDPQDIHAKFEAWVADMVSDGFEYRVTIDDQVNQPAYATPRDFPPVTVLRQAMSDAWGMEAGWMRNAGSAPGALLAQRVGRPVLFFGTGLPEDRWHDADESIDVRVLLNGAATMALFWPRVAGTLAHQ